MGMRMREAHIGNKEEDMTPSSITERPEFMAGQWSLHLPAPFSVPSSASSPSSALVLSLPQSIAFLFHVPNSIPRSKEPLCGLLNQVLLTQPPIKDRGENGELLAASLPPLSVSCPPQACPLSLYFVILGGVHLPKALSLDNSGLLR